MINNKKINIATTDHKALKEILFPYVIKRENDMLQNDKYFAHYSKIDGIKGILKSKEFWLMNITSHNIESNDSYEFIFGKEVILNIFNDYNIQKYFNNILGQIGVDFTIQRVIDTLLEDIHLEKSSIYIGCLTEHNNEEKEFGRKEMWNNYGRNGAAINISGKILKISNIYPQLFWMFVPVIYVNENLNDASFYKLVVEIFQVIDNISRFRFSSYKDDYEENLLFSYIITVLIVFMVTIKREKYKDEIEWRILLIDSQKLFSNVKNPSIKFLKKCNDKCILSITEMLSLYKNRSCNYLNLLENYILEPNNKISENDKIEVDEYFTEIKNLR